MKKILLFFMVVIVVGVIANAQKWIFPEPEYFPSLLSSTKIEGQLDFCGEVVPIDEPEIMEDFEKEFMISLWNRFQVILWMKRAGRYMPVIEKMLKQNGMPDDLKYVAIVESSLMPHIGSPKNAVGYWQFIEPTGTRYGLRIDSEIDERRNIFKSTNAAIRYFKDLYSEFGSWTLSAAAYNMGEAGLRNNILEQKTNNYYHLYLPIETQRYIHKIIAAKLIMSNPEKYGFFMKPRDYYSPLEYDRVEVVCQEETHIQQIAEAANTYFKTIKDMNPEIRGRILQKGTYILMIPKGSGHNFHQQFNRISQLNSAKIEAKKTDDRKRFYVVKRGENLSSIAAKLDVTVSELMAWNRLKNKEHIRPGDRLIYMKE